MNDADADISRLVGTKSKLTGMNMKQILTDYKPGRSSNRLRSISIVVPVCMTDGGGRLAIAWFWLDSDIGVSGVTKLYLKYVTFVCSTMILPSFMRSMQLNHRFKCLSIVSTYFGISS